MTENRAPSADEGSRAGSGKRNPYSKAILFCVCLFLVLLVLQALPSRILDAYHTMISRNAAAQLLKQLHDVPLPDKTDRIEEISYFSSSGESAMLLLKSDLSKDKIANEFNTVNFKPVNGSLKINVKIGDQDSFTGISMMQCINVAEHMASEFSCKMDRYQESSNHKFYYLIETDDIN